MIRVLFVCTGNTCRSPMAEAILRNKNIDNLEVRSAGVYAIDGSNASFQAQEVLTEKGIEHNHSSSMLTKELVDWATHILTMTSSHKHAITSQFPSSVEKTFTIREYANDKTRGDIRDPFGGSVDQYRETYDELEDLMEEVIKNLLDWDKEIMF